MTSEKRVKHAWEFNVQVNDGVWYAYTFYIYYHFLFKAFLSGRKPPGNLKAANRL